MSDFSANLAAACSHYRSISEVCRRIGINRQQFNKYLSGQTVPSRHNLRRIADFFGVTDAEMTMEQARFARLIGQRRPPAAPPPLEGRLRHLERILAVSHPVDRYAGYYFRHFYSFGNAGYVIRSLMRVVVEEGRGYFKNVEVLHDPATGRWTRTNKYEGVLFQLADRLQAFEYETTALNSVTQMTLYPDWRKRMDVLVGIQTGGPTRRGRKPGASRVALEYLGPEIGVLDALRRTGLYRPDDPDLRPDIVALIENRIDERSFVLDIEEP